MRFADQIAPLVADVADFPEPGITFRDITPLLRSPAGLAAGVNGLLEVSPTDVDVVIGLEARGFIFAAPVALALGAGFVPIRKPGRLPRETISAGYELEYGTETLTVHADALTAGDRVLVVDDVLATGGTALAAADLVRRLGGELVGVSVLMELTYLPGRERLAAAGITDLNAVLALDTP